MSDKSKRKSFSKKERFEIFKRDNFTCQYCGRKAPNIILEIDHIKPIAEGGNNGLSNLITSCLNCNRGKGARELSNDIEIQKQKKYLKKINERRKQLEMLAKWREELLNLEEEKINRLSAYWHKLTEKRFFFSATFRDETKELLDKFGFEELIQALEIARDNYLVRDKAGKFTLNSSNKALEKLGGICYIKKQERSKPYIRKLHYIKGILRNRLRYFDKRKTMKWLTMAYKKGVSLERLEEQAKVWKNWTEFRSEIFDLINKKDS